MTDAKETALVDPSNPLAFLDRHSLMQADGAVAEAYFDRHAQRMFHQTWEQIKEQGHFKGDHSEVDALINKLSANVCSQYFTLRRVDQTA